MADTERSLTDLAALLANNSTRDISAQDVRDFLQSTFSSYATIYTHDTSAAQTVVLNTPEILVIESDGISSGCTPDASNNKITVDVAGDYQVNFQASFTHDQNNTLVYCHLYKQGTAQDVKFQRKIGTGGDQGSASFTWQLTCAASDRLEIWVEASVSGDVTVEDCQFCVKRIG